MSSLTIFFLKQHVRTRATPSKQSTTSLIKMFLCYSIRYLFGCRLKWFSKPNLGKRSLWRTPWRSRAPIMHRRRRKRRQRFRLLSRKRPLISLLRFLLVMFAEISAMEKERNVNTLIRGDWRKISIYPSHLYSFNISVVVLLRRFLGCVSFVLRTWRRSRKLLSMILFHPPLGRYVAIRLMLGRWLVILTKK